VTPPANAGPIGPYPSSVDDTDEGRDAYDRTRRRVLWSFPSGLYVVGSRHGDRLNGMTLNWLTQVSFDPKLVGIAVEREALTHELIASGGSFAVSVVAREDRALVRSFTKPVEADAANRTLNGIAYVEHATGCPVLAQAVAYVDCEVRQTLDAGDHTFFVGEVLDAGFLQAEDTDVLRMEDTRMNYGG
jgi:flavin reductase (DIM6/NTAB) family NADH-FMN oxidoreductase RutF